MKLRVYIHRLTDIGSGEDAAPDVDVLPKLAAMQEEFAPYGIYFTVAADYVDDEGAPSNVCQPLPVSYHEDGIDIYVLTSGDRGTSCFQYPDSEGTTTFTVGRYAPAETWIHEMGHMLNLVHTAEGGPTSDCVDETDDCSACFDNVCDTPFVSDGCNPVPGTCDRNIACPPPEVHVENYMFAAFLDCSPVFTREQIDRAFASVEEFPQFYDDIVVWSIQGEPLATFENKSGDTQLGYSGTPSSVAPMDYDKDGDVDYVITFGSNHRTDVWLLDDLTIVSKVPFFQELGEDPLGTATFVEGSVVADYDGDGDEDVIIIHGDAGARIYRNDAGTFTDQTASLGLETLLGAFVRCAAWGDFDDDGDVDLYIGRAQPSQGAIPDFLLRNDVSTTGQFADVTSESLLGGVSTLATATASWADVDGDRDLDLFVGNALGVPSYSNLWINQGVTGGVVTFTEELLQRSPYKMVEVAAMVWADMNGDGSLDIVTARNGGLFDSPTIFFNDGGGNFNERLYLPGGGKEHAGIAPIDYDLDGDQDLLALPVDSSPPWLFENFSSTEGPVFVNLAAERGLTGTGAVGGVLVTDYHDGDPDIYFGRPTTGGSEFFYRNVSAVQSSDDPENSWVGVRLAGNGSMNSLALGTRLVLKRLGVPVLAQIVDGGSGRASQMGRDMIFGGVDDSGEYSLEVVPPFGCERVFTIAATPGPKQLGLNEMRSAPVLVGDQSVVPNSEVVTVTPGPGSVLTVVITWKTEHDGDPEQDSVSVSSTGGCDVIPNLGINTSGVVIDDPVFVDGQYLHTVTYVGSCVPVCNYSYTVSSGCAQGTVKSFKTKFCVQ